MSDTPVVHYPSLMREKYHAVRKKVVGEEALPKILYHYTSMEAAQLILEASALRFSHTYFMNDALEIRKGLEIIFHTLHDFAEGQEEHKDAGSLLVHLAYAMVFILEDEETRLKTLESLEAQGLKEIHPKQFEQFALFNQTDFFITCFSECKDSLPMWYMYADNAKGVSLGFDFPNLLAEHNKLLEQKGYLLSSKVIYDEAVFRGLVNLYIEDVFNFLITFKKEHGDFRKLKHGEIGNDFYFSAMYYLLVLVVSFKDSAFEHEQEWRLFTILPRTSRAPQKKFAVHKGTLKPYHFITYPTANAQKLKKLIVGPGNPNSAEWLKVYLAHIASTCEKIVLSKVPFRNV